MLNANWNSCIQKLIKKIIIKKSLHKRAMLIEIEKDVLEL